MQCRKNWERKEEFLVYPKIKRWDLQICKTIHILQRTFEYKMSVFLGKCTMAGCVFCYIIIV